ncbi:hypothetical protein [Halorarius halobius]|uniref:hypothetical protein n=1 Tax=Halorarius halobius TaxID=2962671 RepID=UPI0020CC7FA9|nr:hypothetical protein [Halorarius halobius]
MPRNSLAAGWQVGRVEFHRSLRALRTKGLQLVGLAVAVLLFGGVAVGVAALVVVTSPDLSAVAVTDSTRGPVALQWLFAVALLTQRVTTLHDRPDAEAFLLTTVRLPAAVIGLLFAEWARVLAYIGGPLLVVGAAVAYVSGSPATLLLALLALLLFAASAVVAAQVLGLSMKLAVARVPALARHRTAIGIVLAVAAFGGYAAVGNLGGATSMLAVLPVGWLLDLVLVATPASVSLGHAAGAAVLLAGWSVAGAALSTRVASALWLGDSVEPAVEAAAAEVGTDGTDPLAAAIAPLQVPGVGSPVARRVAQRSILLVRRAPSKLSFLLAPVAVAATVGVQFLFGEASVPVAALAPLAALFVPWVAGAMFGLNPLGDEGRVLPVTLLSVPSGTAYVRGLVLPALLVGLPGSVLPAGLAVATGYTPVEAAALLVVVAGCVAVAAMVAPGVGFLFPRTEAVRVVRGRELLPPALTAIACYTVVVVGCTATAVASALAPDLARGGIAVFVGGAAAFPFDLAGGTAVADALRGFGDAIRRLPTGAIRVGGVAVPLAAGLALGGLAVRTAARRFDRYTL